MSLVAYNTSSDEEADYEDNKGPESVANTIVAKPQLAPTDKELSNGNISDDDDNAQAEDEEINLLPKFLPKHKNYVNLTEALENFVKPTFAALPTPRAVDTQLGIEDDDEFLHKKPDKNIKIPVKITIPSLKNFHDVEKEISDKARNRNTITYYRASGSSGLLSMLPKAKSEQNFSKVSSKYSKNNESLYDVNTVKHAIHSFVPDSVKHKRPATNTEDVERLKPTKKNLHTQTNKIFIQSSTKADSDVSDDNAGPGNFFSLNTDQSLPEVSATEINTLVAKKAAKMFESAANFLKANESQKSDDVEEMQIDGHELGSTRKCYHQEQQLNLEAIQALVGGSTNRRRQEQSDIEVIDINCSQVMPNKDEWMRRALASSTNYQPTGVLVDEEPASGTRRKHQITYLAHKAKANEAELQAMWSANRQNRRATQSKYGF